MAQQIKGKAVYINLEGGFWGIETDSSKFYPLQMPEQLKIANAAVQCTIKLREDIASIYSWGVPCEIISFSTINPR